MTDAIKYILSDPERFAAEYARELASTTVENQHETYIPELLAPWFKCASPPLREALRNSFRRGHETRRKVEQVLAGVQPIEQFAEPLLKQALAARGWADIDPKTHGIKQGGCRS